MAMTVAVNLDILLLTPQFSPLESDEFELDDFQVQRFYDWLLLVNISWERDLAEGLLKLLTLPKWSCFFLFMLVIGVKGKAQKSIHSSWQNRGFPSEPIPLENSKIGRF